MSDYQTFTGASDYPRFCLSLDVGSERDHSVLTLLDRKAQYSRGPDGEEMQLPTYDLPFLERFQLRTPYEVIKNRTAEILHNPLLSTKGCHLLIDATGVGNPVVQMFQELAPIPVVISSGTSVNALGAGGYSVPKRDIVTSLQAVMQSRRLRIAAGLQDIEQLKKEILGFKMRPPTARGHIAFESDTESTHDDIVMSLAVAVWYLERLYGYKIPAGIEEVAAYDPLVAYS